MLLQFPPTRIAVLARNHVLSVGESWVWGVGQGIEEGVVRQGQRFALTEILQKVSCLVVDQFKIWVPG